MSERIHLCILPWRIVPAMLLPALLLAACAHAPTPSGTSQPTSAAPASADAPLTASAAGVTVDTLAIAAPGLAAEPLRVRVFLPPRYDAAAAIDGLHDGCARAGALDDDRLRLRGGGSQKEHGG